MWSGDRNKSKYLLTYVVNKLMAVSDRYILYTGYFFVGMALSLLINLGSAWKEPDDRIASDRFFPVWLGTVLLLLIYAGIISRMHQRLVLQRPAAARKGVRLLLYFGLASLTVLALHGLVLEILLPGQPGFILFSADYLESDFLYFFPCIVVYVILLWLWPSYSLFPASSADPSVPQATQQKAIGGQGAARYIPADDRTPAQRPEPEGRRGRYGRMGALQAEMQDADGYLAADAARHAPFGIDRNQTLAILWMMWSRHRDTPALMEYLLAKEGLPDTPQIRCLHAVIIVKGRRTAQAYLHDGSSCIIKITAQALKEHPWLVKISATVYVNMLYFQVVSNRPDDLIVSKGVAERLGKRLSDKKLKELLFPSRDLRVNIIHFWGEFSTLDESRLYDLFEPA